MGRGSELTKRITNTIKMDLLGIHVSQNYCLKTFYSVKTEYHCNDRWRALGLLLTLKYLEIAGLKPHSGDTMIIVVEQ